MSKPKRLHRDKPFTNLYEDGITYSKLQTFLLCRERYRLEMVEGMRETQDTTALDFGNIFHLLFERSLHVPTDQLGPIERRLIRETGKVSAENQLMAMTICMMHRHYREFYGEYDKVRSVVAAEQKFCIPYRVQYNGKTIPIRGKCDGVLKQDGKLFILEHKTKGQIDKGYIVSMLPFDLQTMIYAWAMEHVHGQKIHGVIYDVIRRPQHKQGAKETQKDFIDRLSEHIQKEPEHFFFRVTSEFAPNDVQNFCNKFLFPVLEGLSHWWESIAHNPFDPWVSKDGTPNPHHFIRPFGIYDAMSRGYGPYFNLIVNGNYADLVPAETPFPELVD